MIGKTIIGGNFSLLRPVCARKQIHGATIRTHIVIHVCSNQDVSTIDCHIVTKLIAGSAILGHQLDGFRHIAPPRDRFVIQVNGSPFPRLAIGAGHNRITIKIHGVPQQIPLAAIGGCQLGHLNPVRARSLKNVDCSGQIAIVVAGRTNHESGFRHDKIPAESPIVHTITGGDYRRLCHILPTTCRLGKQIDSAGINPAVVVINHAPYRNEIPFDGD